MPSEELPPFLNAPTEPNRRAISGKLAAIKRPIIHVASLALVLLFCVWVARRILIEHFGFKCGSQWHPPSCPWDELLALRFGFAAAGCLIALLMALPLGRPYALRAVNAALGITCVLLAFFGGGWQQSANSYLNGLSSVVAKPEMRTALNEVRAKAKELPVETHIKPEDMPAALRELGTYFGGGNLRPSGELRLSWGRRGIGAWGISISSVEPNDRHAEYQNAYDDVYVFMIPPF